MQLPISSSEADRPELSSRVAVSILGRTVLEIHVGLPVGKAASAASVGYLADGRQVWSGLPGDGYAGAPLEYADNGQIPRPVHQIPTRETPVHGGGTELSHISADENNAMVNFLDSLSFDERQELESIADKRVFASGARLMQEGERANHVAVILSGWTEIRVLEKGVERAVARRGPGQLVGERAALQISVRSATVVAIQTVEALVMSTANFAAFVSAHPPVLEIIENQIYTRLRERPVGGDQSQQGWPLAERPGHGFSSEQSRPRQPVLSGENCTVVRTDVAAFGADKRSDEDRRIIRQATYQMTRTALGSIWDACQWEDRGDGLLLVAPPVIPTARIMERLQAGLAQQLKRHNRIYTDSIRIQLRVAVDVGPVTDDATGMSGKSIILAARMLDAPAFKDLLAESGASLGIIASTFVFDTAVKHGGGSLDPDHYVQVKVEVKETSIIAWMQLIGRAVPPPRQPLMRASQDGHFQLATSGASSPCSRV